MAHRWVVYREADGYATNVVVWDGESWKLNDGEAVEELENGSTIGIGWRRLPDGTWLGLPDLPPPEPEPEVEPDPQENP